MDISVLLENLSWHMPKEVQEAAITELLRLKDDELHILLQPNYKDCWDNAALLIKKIGYPRIKKIIPGMFDWLQDINWPGAFIIIEALAEIGKKEILPFIEKLLTETNDDQWIYGILLLVEEMELKEADFSNPDLYDKLQFVKFLKD